MELALNNFSSWYTYICWFADAGSVHTALHWCVQCVCWCW